MVLRTIHDVTRERASREPAREAIVDGALRLGNAALLARVDRIAKALLARGVARGDRVATLAPPSADFWLLFLATSSLGAIWQGLNPRYQRNEYASLLGDARPRLVFARSPFEGRDYLAELRALAPRDTEPIALGEQALGADDCPFARGGGAVPDAQLAAARARALPEDAAVIVYTSGTTGQPKGALLSHRAIVGTALANVAWAEAGALDCTICPAPINHVGALDNVCMTVFAAGGRIVFFPRVDLNALGALTRREQPTYLVSSPTAFAMMLARAGGAEARRGGYRLVVFGGAATPAATLRAVLPLAKRFVGVYGQTETCGMITATPVDASVEVMAETIGRPVAGVELRIANESAPLALGETGEIQVRGVCTMSGYWGKLEATREAFTRDGWLRTGDLGFQREDGDVVFVGRLKEMFKSGGYNVYPVEVELAICEHPDVAQAAVVAVPHPVFQEVGHGFVQPRPGAALDPAELRAFLRERIADFKVPKSWTVLDAFPALPNGKVDKRALRATLPD